MVPCLGLRVHMSVRRLKVFVFIIEKRSVSNGRVQTSTKLLVYTSLEKLSKMSHSTVSLFLSSPLRVYY